MRANPKVSYYREKNWLVSIRDNSWGDVQGISSSGVLEIQQESAIATVGWL